MYNNMSTKHLIAVGGFLISSPSKYSWFIESEVFGRCTDLHSVIISLLYGEFLLPEDRNVLDHRTDLTLNSVRDEIKSRIHTDSPHLAVENLEGKLYLLSQLSLNSSYLKLLLTTWLLLRQDYFTIRDDYDSGEANPDGGVTEFLGRFCKPPPPLIPLPAVFGKFSGQMLSEILVKTSGFSEFFGMYLSVGVSMSSVDLGDLIKHLGEWSIQRHEDCDIVGMLVKELCDNKVAASRYHQDLIFLWNCISQILVETDFSIKPMSDLVAQCELVCTVYNLAALLKTEEQDGVEEFLSSCFTIALSLLRDPTLGFIYKIKLTQNLLDNLGDQVIQFTETLLNENDGLHLVNESEVDLKTTNNAFIETLISSLPNKNAEFLLHHTKFDPSLVETISCETVPVSLIPKFINKLSKVQVMSSLRSGCDDPQLLSKCLLSLVHHNYPIHLFNTIYNSILKLIANESYIHTPQTISNIVRASELLSKQKDVARHHVPYILCNIFEYVSKSNPVLVKDITPAVYPLFDVCLVQGLQFLQARLSQPARQLFLQLQNHYKQNIKYQGKT